MTNILDKLKHEHQEVANLLEQASSDNQSLDKKKKLFDNINKQLILHMEYEEELFYPTIKENPATKNIVLEGYEEHNVAKTLLKELQELPVEDEMWLAKLTVLKENIQHHVQEEEQNMFPKVEKMIDEEELQDMAEEMQEFKQQQLESLSSGATTI